MKINMSLVYAGLNGINQITSRSIFQKDFTAYNKPFRRFLKNIMGYTGVMDEHHIFPRCLKDHPVLYDIEFNSGKNLKLMPNRCAKKQLRQNNTTESNVILKHESHPAYSHYVKTQLDLIDPYGQDREYQIWLLLGHLEKNLNFEGQIPFKNWIEFD
jgi:hypothetical protein